MLSLVQVPGMDEGLADRLFAGGLTSAEALAAAGVEVVMSLGRIDQEKAQSLLQEAAREVAANSELQAEEAECQTPLQADDEHPADEQD